MSEHAATERVETFVYEDVVVKIEPDAKHAHLRRATINGRNLNFPVMQTEKGYRLVLDERIPKAVRYGTLRTNVAGPLDTCMTADVHRFYLRDVIELLRNCGQVDITHEQFGLVFHPLDPRQSVVVWGLHA